MENKDYSLLRPFDLEAAKRGEAIIGKDDGESRTFITGPDKHGYFVVESKEGWYRFGKPEDYRMAPLAWVKGKPVYKGDVLHRRLGDSSVRRVTADRVSADPDGDVFLHFVEGGDSLVSGPSVLACDLTWTTPMVKREGWINITNTKLARLQKGLVEDRIARNADIFGDEQAAKDWAAHCEDVIATIRIEWEEPAV